MVRQVCKPSRGVTKNAEPTISFSLFKTKHSRVTAMNNRIGYVLTVYNSKADIYMGIVIMQWE